MVHLQGISASSSYTLEALAKRLVEIEGGDRLLRADRFTFLPCLADIVHMPVSVTPGEASDERTSTLATGDEVFEQGLDSGVRSSFRPMEFQFLVHLEPQLAGDNGGVLARIHSAFVRDISSIEDIRQQQPQSGHTEELTAMPLAAPTRPVLGGPVSCTYLT